MLCKVRINFRNVEVSVDGKKQGVTRKMKNTKQSRMGTCKIELLRNFMDIQNMLNFNITAQLQYNKIKAMCTNYQNAWKMVKNDIFKVYTSKNPMLLCFKLD